MNDVLITVGSLLGGISTLMIAILTIAYVKTTSKQMKIMDKQLAEMKQSRYLMAQPLLTFEIKSVTISPPRFCYNPVKNDYAWPSQLEIKYSVSNSSGYSAVNIQLFPFIKYCVNSKELLYKEYANYIGFIEAAKTAESNIVFSDDSGDFVKSLCQSQSVRSSPALIIKILYKNILGAYFLCEYNFNIFVEWRKTNENWERAHKILPILENWYCRINNFHLQFANELKHIKTLTPRASTEWEICFDQINERYRSKDDDIITVDAQERPDSFKVKVIEDIMVADELADVEQIKHELGVSSDNLFK